MPAKRNRATSGFHNHGARAPGIEQPEGPRMVGTRHTHPVVVIMVRHAAKRCVRVSPAIAPHPPSPPPPHPPARSRPSPADSEPYGSGRLAVSCRNWVVAAHTVSRGPRPADECVPDAVDVVVACKGPDSVSPRADQRRGIDHRTWHNPREPAAQRRRPSRISSAASSSESSSMSSDVRAQRTYPSTTAREIMIRLPTR